MGTDNRESFSDLISITDRLTGFGNLKYMEQMMEELLSTQDAVGQCWAVVIDDFQDIREEKGYMFTDEVICDIARFLSQVFFMDEASIAHKEGNEFLLTTYGEKTEEEILQIAEKLNEGIEHLYKDENIYCNVTVSIGISLIPEHGKAYWELLEKAERAAQHCIVEGGNKAAIYCDEFVQAFELESEMVDWEPVLSEMMPVENLAEYYFRFFADSKDTESTVNMVLKRILDIYDVDQAFIMVAKESKMSLKCRYESCRDNQYSIIGHKVGFSKRGWMEHLERCRRQPYVKVTREDTSILTEVFKQLPDDTAIVRSSLFLADDFVGGLCLADYKGTKNWTREDRQNLETLSKIMANYLVVRGGKVEDRWEKDKTDFGTDSLTGLYNLETFSNIAEELMKSAHNMYVLVYMDIGNFNAINRDFGYETGDEVLKKCGQLLQEKVEDVVLVGRIYGDKFAVLCKKNRDFNKEQIIDNAVSINRTIQKEIQKLCEGESFLIYTGMCDLADESDISVALSKAKMAKDFGKQQWSNKLVIYEPWMSDSSRKSYELLGKVDSAIADHEFMVYLQPKVDSETMAIVGAEALIRWREKNGSMVFPDEFIPVFEKNGKIVDVDYFVYEEVFRYLRRRLDEGKKVVPISMNVSRIHLKSGNFMEKVNQLLDTYKVPTEYLEFELTENVYVEKFDEALPFVEHIREKKIKVSIDDFGSGYSSLNVISSIPIDILKLDKVFMKRGEELSKKDKTVISHLLQMAKAIDLEVICEGVETQVQADFVKDIGCNAWQGYYFAKPMPMDEFDECLDTHKVGKE